MTHEYRSVNGYRKRFLWCDVVVRRKAPGACPLTRSLEVDNVRVQFKQNTILDGLSLAVENDEFVSIVGTSGCGKTTLLRSIGGLLPQAEIGGMELHGTPLRTPEPRVAMVFQHFGLF